MFDLEQRIYDLLRKPVRAAGIAKLYPYTFSVEFIHINEIHSLPSLALGAGNFFADKTLSVLAAEQAITPIQTTSALAGGISEDEDLDAFLLEIYSARR